MPSGSKSARVVGSGLKRVGFLPELADGDAHVQDSQGRLRLSVASIDSNDSVRCERKPQARLRLSRHG